MFGDDVPERFLGGYLSVVSVPKSLAREGEMNGYFEPRRVAMVYTADHLDDARAVFIFRPERPLDYDHRDVPRQRDQLRAAFRGVSEEVDSWLAHLERTPAFYFDAITQLEMSTWSRGRVTSSATPATPVRRSAAAPASRCTAPTCLPAKSPARVGITLQRSSNTFTAGSGTSGQLTLENDFLESALTKVGLLSAKR